MPRALCLLLAYANTLVAGDERVDWFTKIVNGYSVGHVAA
jgi:hypothetical protein